MAYDRINFIGYVIDTAPKKISDTKQEYLGLPNPAQDIAARCQLLLDAITLAQTAIPAASPPGSTLNVFMAPEFYFRGKTGAYAMDDVQLAIAALQEMVADAQWEDWVFVFGTIVGSWLPEISTDPVQICNFALIQEGGVAAKGPDGARIVTKELKSGIDFISGVANPGGMLLGAVDPPSAGPSGNGQEQQVVAYDGAGIFQLAGMEWAAEICLDYLQRRLQQSPQFPGDPVVQVQLVPSCGASLQPGNHIAGPGGLLFNVDGYRDTAHAQLVQIAAPPTPSVVITPAGAHPLTVTSVTLPDSSPPVVVPVSDIYALGAGTVVVYPPQPVPPAATVPGTPVAYSWPASLKPKWTFVFTLVYDLTGNISQVFVQIFCAEINFNGYYYFIPLTMTPLFAPTPPSITPFAGLIDFQFIPSSTYDYAIIGHIKLPGFNFQGTVMEFMKGQIPSKPMRKCW